VYNFYLFFAAVTILSEEIDLNVPNPSNEATNKAIYQPNEELLQKLSPTHCRPIISRRLLWNWTRTGEVVIQPCPVGASGLAR